MEARGWRRKIWFNPLFLCRNACTKSGPLRFPSFIAF